MKLTAILILSIISASSAVHLKLLAQDEIIKFIELRTDIFDESSSEDVRSLLSEILVSGDLDPIYALNAGQSDISASRTVKASETTQLTSGNETLKSSATRSSNIWTKTIQSGKQTKFAGQVTNNVDVRNGTGTITGIQNLTLTAQVTIIKFNGLQSNLARFLEDDYPLIAEAQRLVENVAGFGEFFQDFSVEQLMPNSTIVRFHSTRADVITYDNERYEKDLKSSGIVLVLGQDRKIVSGRIKVEGRETTPDGLFRPLATKVTNFSTTISK